MFGYRSELRLHLLDGYSIAHPSHDQIAQLPPPVPPLHGWDHGLHQEGIVETYHSLRRHAHDGVRMPV